MGWGGDEGIGDEGIGGGRIELLISEITGSVLDYAAPHKKLFKCHAYFDHFPPIF